MELGEFEAGPLLVSSVNRGETLIATMLEA